MFDEISLTPPPLAFSHVSFIIQLFKTSFLTFCSAAELESVKALFAEKEKELALCFAKVEEMTQQLKQLRNGTPNGTQQKHDIERLKQELLVSSQEQICAEISCQHRFVLSFDNSGLCFIKS